MPSLLQRPRRRAPEDQPTPANGRVPATIAQRRPLARVGRWAIVAAFVWLIVFGIVGQLRLATLDLPARVRDLVRASGPVGAQAWPGDDAKAFAALFASTLEAYSPRNPDERVAALRAMVVSSLDPEQILGGTGQATQKVTGAWPSRPRRIDSQHATITVAVNTLTDRKAPATIYLSVPVARDDHDGLVVYDYPAVTSPPPAANAPALRTTQPEPQVAEAVESLLDRFFAEQYMLGGPVAPEFLVPGATIVPLGRRYTGVSVSEVAQVEPSTRTIRTVLVKVNARDAATEANLTLRYRVQVQWRDLHWLVQSVVA